MHQFITFAPRVIALGAGVAVGSGVVKAAWENGMAFGGLAFALAFAGTVVGCWVLLPIAKTAPPDVAIILRVIFAVGTLFVIGNAVRSAAGHMSHNAGDAANQITAYDAAETAYARLSSELDIAKTNKRWAATTGCTDATVPKSDAYCQGVRRIQTELEDARKTIARGKPKSADPGGDVMAFLLGTDVKMVDIFWPVLIAVALDLMATGLVTAALSPARQGKRVQQTASPAPEPAPAPHEEAPGETLAALVFLQMLLDARENATPVWLSSEPMKLGPTKKAGPFTFNMDRRSCRPDHLAKRVANGD